MKPSRPIPTPPAYDDTTFMEHLLEEYSMLQGKVDTIGGFRISIKGWSVAALAAAAAASTKVGPGKTLLLSGGLAVLIFIFFLLEFEQVRLSAIYSARAGRIERAIMSIKEGRGEVRYRRMAVPFTATEVALIRHRGGYAESDSRLTVARRSHMFLYAILLILALLIGGKNWISEGKSIAGCIAADIHRTSGAQPAHPGNTR